MMTPAQIKSIRTALSESTAEFAARFARSSRTIEDWEQGRRNPDSLVVSLLLSLEKKLSKKVK